VRFGALLVAATNAKDLDALAEVAAKLDHAGLPQGEQRAIADTISDRGRALIASARESNARAAMNAGAGMELWP
jgi:hypothetical protein